MSNLNLSSETQFNFLKASQFQLVIPRLPNVSFYATNVRIPDISVGNVEVGSPFKKMNFTGDTAEFGDLSVTFLIDSNLNNYYELFDWMRGYSRINSYQNLKDYVAANEGNPEKILESDLITDVHLIIIGDKGCEHGRFEFKDSYPVSLTGFEVITQNTDVQYLTATATFKHSYFDLVRE